jgi:uncharacterized pyridoxal phosphate-containing UPF0001 family protein
MTDVAANYRAIVERVRQAAVSTGRDPREIKILAAAKAQDIKSIEAAIVAGALLIGELRSGGKPEKEGSPHQY